MLEELDKVRRASRMRAGYIEIRAIKENKKDVRERRVTQWAIQFSSFPK